MNTNKEEENFREFLFAELINMVRAIARTKKASSSDFWRGGSGLLSMEFLESHADQILEELARRIRESWTLNRILMNIKVRKSNLPDSVRNLFSINACELCRMIYKEIPLIGASVDENQEQIYYIQGSQKYTMKYNGEIEIESKI
jgi:hypothetical protein